MTAKPPPATSFKFVFQLAVPDEEHELGTMRMTITSLRTNLGEARTDAREKLKAVTLAKSRWLLVDWKYVQNHV